MTPEFSRPVVIDEIGERELVRDIEANDEERAALGKRFGLVSLGRLKASVHLKWVQGRKLLQLTGAFEADVEQSCVVTLEPVQERIAETLDILFERPAKPADLDERAVEVTSVENAEPLPETELDIGEVVAEELALSLNPYPRKPDATFGDKEAAERTPSPFDVLARLKRTN
jgi:uncharacterized metal-binding protein YceD (DUF177 family)